MGRDGIASNPAPPCRAASRSTRVSPSAFIARLQRRRPDDLPTMTIEHRLQLGLAHLRELAPGAALLFDEPARFARRVEKQHLPARGPGALPAVGDAARHEGDGPGAA